MPTPTHAHGFWVGMGAILLVMLQILNTWAQFEYQGWPWVGTCHAMGGHRSLLMSVVWLWVQI